MGAQIEIRPVGRPRNDEATGAIFSAMLRLLAERGKITPEGAAAEVVEGLKAGRSEIYVYRAKLLHMLMRVSPGLGEKLMRGG